MVRKRKIHIVDPDLIFSEPDIRNMMFSEYEIYRLINQKFEMVELLAKLKLIQNEKFCALCGCQMSLVKINQKQTPLRWICVKPCFKTETITSMSFLSSFNITFYKFLLAIYKYIKGDEIENISNEININIKTLGDLFDALRDEITKSFIKTQTAISGVYENGQKAIVEIDESLFFKRKYNRGRLNESQWYVGGIERGTRNCFIVPVPNRKSETMKQILETFILPGSIVITDCWRAYGKAISEMDSDLVHSTINHSLNFVDPNDPQIHTQNIEGLWSRLKYFLRQEKGSNINQRGHYLIQFL